MEEDRGRPTDPHTPALYSHSDLSGSSEAGALGGGVALRSLPGAGKPLSNRGIQTPCHRILRNVRARREGPKFEVVGGTGGMCADDSDHGPRHAGEHIDLGERAGTGHLRAFRQELGSCGHSMASASPFGCP